MDKSQGSYLTHVFVCTNQKKSGECCAPHGGEELRRQLKDWIATKPEWKKKIRINVSGCLDRCQEGVAIAIYPQEQWITNARLEDLEAIKAEIEAVMHGA